MEPTRAGRRREAIAPVARSAATTLPLWAIVLAAGEGTRFGVRKQFDPIAGHRPVDLAIDAVRRAGARVVLVLPADYPWHGATVEKVVSGGADRGASVQAGLAEISDDDAVVVVHQAANPLATPALVQRLVTRVRQGDPAAVPGLRPADLVRRAEDEHLGEVVGRDDLVLVQTPAAFLLSVLRAAHARGTGALEDTALVSALGVPVTVIEGDPRNVHLARPADGALVAALLTTSPQISGSGFVGC
jgi:2-C-methyl-D-erythritol 4-phosphate cytidylyltransferase